MFRQRGTSKRTRSTFLTALALGVLALNARADLVVLQYHHISDSTPSSTSTAVSLFKAQLNMIEETGMPVVPLEPGTADALAGKEAGKNQIAITFDDAFDSIYTTAEPILAEHNYPYTIFVSTAAVGRPGYMSWDQLAELAGKARVTIANHSTNHSHMAKRPDESSDSWHKRVTTSLDGAQAQLQEKLGESAPMFAYPYGEFDEALEQLVAERDWYGFGQQSGAIGKSSGPTRLPRFPMANAYGQLGSLGDKLKSKAFPINAADLPDGIMTENPPRLTLALPDDFTPSRLTCFASGMGRIEFTRAGENRVTVQAPRAFDSRRFRYNCTYPAGGGSFYWLSQQWLDQSKPED
jgi:peptidoglycan/xylan/chitin deacetylase (PgdA/CDA1 family)